MPSVGAAERPELCAGGSRTTLRICKLAPVAGICAEYNFPSRSGTSYLSEPERPCRTSALHLGNLFPGALIKVSGV